MTWSTVLLGEVPEHGWAPTYTKQNCSKHWEYALHGGGPGLTPRSGVRDPPEVKWFKSNPRHGARISVSAPPGAFAHRQKLEWK